MKKLIAFCLVAFLITSCASVNKHGGKLKRGEPIPCPNKDC